jgi:response regulator NasT
MDLIVFADNAESSWPLMHVASKAGCRVCDVLTIDDEAALTIERVQPDVVIFLIDQVSTSAINKISTITEKQPVPMLVFTRDSRSESISAAVAAGVSAFVIDCNDISRLDSLIKVARVRFREQQRIMQELRSAKNALRDRKRIEKAKGIIMQSKRLSEDQAYSAMRKLAMNHNKRIGEIAEQIISASEVLV